MGMGFAPTWLRQVSPPLLHKTTLTTGGIFCGRSINIENEIMNVHEIFKSDHYRMIDTG